jgi:DNA-binding CsgD family transcriptional regulator
MLAEIAWTAADQVTVVQGRAEIGRLTAELRRSAQRDVADLPMRMVLVDHRAALLSLDPEAAVLLRSPALVAALHTYFDLLWERAIRLDGEDTGLSETLHQVLRLLVTGMTDVAIARRLGISERTVRRHVVALQQRLQAGNRVALAAAAVRQGWVA